MGLNSLFIFSTIVLSSVCLFVWLPAFVTSEEYIYEFDLKYGTFSEKKRVQMLEEAKQMFSFALNSYMKYAFPKDELNPISCTGRGPEWYDDPVKGNGVVGNYLLTLVDSLDTLAIAGRKRQFQVAVAKVIGYMNFDRDVEVLVLEANIRVLGGLLSAHLIITDPKKPFGDLRPEWYDDDLLELAEDLGYRLLPAFKESPTGLPYTKVNLRYGVPKNTTTITCPAAAGTFILEFGVLSRLTNDSIFEEFAREALRTLWQLRPKETGLLGDTVDMETARWIGHMSGLGAGIDSYYEYLLKSYIMFGDEEDLQMFSESYRLIKKYIRVGRKLCNSGYGTFPNYLNVNMFTGETYNSWIDALQAFFPGLQVLYGDVEEAVCAHLIFYGIWRKYGGMPDRFNWYVLEPEFYGYPLRPELAESTYFLYKATGNPFYLHVGMNILRTIDTRTLSPCGYATLDNVETNYLVDHMESFFLSETCKYLILLFDEENYVNKHSEQYIFTTEGHLFPVKQELRVSKRENIKTWARKYLKSRKLTPFLGSAEVNTTCNAVDKDMKRGTRPLKEKHMVHVAKMLDISEFHPIRGWIYDD